MISRENSSIFKNSIKIMRNNYSCSQSTDTSAVFSDFGTSASFSDILLLKKILFYLLFSYDTIILILVYFQFTQ